MLYPYMHTRIGEDMPTGISNGNSHHMRRLRAELEEALFTEVEPQEKIYYWRVFKNGKQLADYQCSKHEIVRKWHKFFGKGYSLRCTPFLTVGECIRLAYMEYDYHDLRETQEDARQVGLQ